MIFRLHLHELEHGKTQGQTDRIHKQVLIVLENIKNILFKKFYTHKFLNLIFLIRIFSLIHF